MLSTVIIIVKIKIAMEQPRKLFAKNRSCEFGDKLDLASNVHIMASIPKLAKTAPKISSMLPSSLLMSCMAITIAIATKRNLRKFGRFELFLVILKFYPQVTKLA